MSATADDVAATTAVLPAPDGDTEPPQGAESAPAVTNADEETTKVLDPVQKRIDELTRRRYDAERRAEEVARDRDHWRDQVQRAQKPEPAPELQAAGKTLADFGYDEAKYQTYLFAEARNEAVKAAREELTREQQTTQARRRETEFATREQKFSKDLPDYFEVTRGQVPITPEMADVIKESDIGPALAYHLGKNPDVAASIAQLNPLQAARELGRLEAKLAEKPKASAVSNAPPPAPRLGGSGDTGGSVKADSPDSDKLSDAEWNRLRQRQLAARNRK